MTDFQHSSGHCELVLVMPLASNDDDQIAAHFERAVKNAVQLSSLPTFLGSMNPASKFLLRRHAHSMIILCPGTGHRASI